MLCFLRRLFGQNSSCSPERWEEGLCGVPGVAVLLCLLGEEAGVEFPHLHHPFLRQSRVEGNLGGRSGSKGLDIIEAMWIQSQLGLSP